MTHIVNTTELPGVTGITVSRLYSHTVNCPRATRALHTRLVRLGACDCSTAFRSQKRPQRKGGRELRDIRRDKPAAFVDY
jgi:hypothetical protein